MSAAPQPGPWMVETIRYDAGEERYWVVAPPLPNEGKYGMVIAVDVMGTTKTQAKAHAHILAASLDLLTTLERMVVMFGGDPLPVEDRTRLTTEMNNEAILGARAAIAKAEEGSE